MVSVTSFGDIAGQITGKSINADKLLSVAFSCPRVHSDVFDSPFHETFQSGGMQQITMLSAS